MKCLIFYDSITTEAVKDYNEWAKDKPLAKDVIVHSHRIYDSNEGACWLTIAVFFDEKMHPDW